MKRLVIAVVALLAAVPATSTHALEEPAPPADLRVAPDSISLATYRGRTIDLRQGWGSARACHTDDQFRTTCFDSEREMDEFIGASDSAAPSGLRRSALATCSSNVRLYDAISYGSLVVSTGARLVVINLSSWGFDNATTSYRIGACSATFWDGANAGGAVYPGNTSAGAQFPNMVTGWNNTISSIYIS
jgi:hypothetical protein